jgi:hypothetical protein
VLAIAYDPAELPTEEAMQGLKELVGQAVFVDRTINDRCAICGSRASQWFYEDGATKFTTIEEAKPELENTERANMIANSVLRRF